MAKSEKSKTVSGGNGGQFINLRLTEQQVEDLRSNLLTWSELQDHLTDLVNGGYKFSCALDTYSGGYQAFLTGVSKDNVNAGLTLSGRGPQLEGAINSLLYKHFTVLKERWPREKSEKPDTPSWG